MGIPDVSCGRSTEQELGYSGDGGRPMGTVSREPSEHPYNTAEAFLCRKNHKFDSWALSRFSSTARQKFQFFSNTTHSPELLQSLPFIWKDWMCESLYKQTQGNAYSLPRTGRSAVLSIPGPRLSQSLFSFCLQLSL